MHTRRIRRLERKIRYMAPPNAQSRHGLGKSSETTDSPFQRLSDVVNEATNVTQRMISRRRPASVLGRLLLQAAALKQVMDFFWDRKVLLQYLHANPPLHVRRTLYEAYWNMDSKKKDDKRSVLYRATDHATFTEASQPLRAKNTVPRQRVDDGRRLPCVLMVDQLWLWILHGSMSTLKSLLSVRQWESRKSCLADPCAI
jgi:hypothetical protein